MEKTIKYAIEGTSDERLFTALYWNIVRSTKEVNSTRGLTKKTAEVEKALLKECIKRFGLDEKVVMEQLEIKEW